MATSSLCLVALLCAAVATARPLFPSQLGRVAPDPQNPQRFAYTGAQRGRSPLDLGVGDALMDYTLSYDVTLRKGVHSLDNEPTIEAINCSSRYILEVQLSDESAVRAWGPRFMVVGGPEWGCAEQNIARFVAAVMWPAPNRAVFLTTPTPLAWELVHEAGFVHMEGTAVAAAAVSRRDLSADIDVGVSWNSLSNGTVDQEVKRLSLSSCPTCQASGCGSGESKTPLCSLCEEGVELRSEITCTHCMARMRFTHVSFDIRAGLSKREEAIDTSCILRPDKCIVDAWDKIFKDLHLGDIDKIGKIMDSLDHFIDGLKKIFQGPVAALQLDGQLDVNLGDLEVNVSAALHKQLSVQLVGKSIALNKGASVGSGSFSVAVGASIDLFIDAKLDGYAVVSTGYNKNLDFSIKATGGLGGNSGKVTVTNREVPVTEPHTTIKASAAAEVVIGIKPSVSFKVEPWVGGVEAEVSPQVRSTARLQFPPFQPLAAPKLVSDSLLSFGDCTKHHAGEFQAQFEVPASASFKLLSASKTLDIDVIQPIHIVGGCFVHMDGNGTELPSRVVNFARNLSDVIPRIKSSSMALETGIARDISAALGSDPSNFRVSQTGPAELTVQITADNEKTGRALAAKLDRQLRARGSELWAGPVMSRFAHAYTEGGDFSAAPAMAAPLLLAAVAALTSIAF
eukprot:m51a1_g5498 hypothetical protein (681) ;mRNA; f:350018-352159